MALKDAILEIVQQIEEVANEFSDPSDIATIKGFARQLKTAVKAAENTEPVIVQQAPILPAEMQHVLEIEKAKAEFRKKREQVEMEEKHSERMVECIGGIMDTNFAQVSPEMPVGASTLLGEEVYTLKPDNKLHFNQTQTTRRKEGKSSV